MATLGTEPARLMMDPSLLLARTGELLLEESAELGTQMVAPASLVNWVFGEAPFEIELLVARPDAEEASVHFGRLADRIERGELARFSYEEARLPDHANEVLVAILEMDHPAREVWADEWAFLHSNSWLASKLRQPLDVFRDRGTTIVEVGRRTGVNLIARVVPREHIPSSITPKLIAKASVKWLVVGGVGIGGGTLGGLVGTMAGGPVGSFIGTKAGGLGAGALASSALLAIDP